MSNALVPADRAIINFGRIHHYQLMWAKVTKEREKYKKLYEQILKICNMYYEKEESLTKIVVSLRREIRMQTRGTPVTIAQDSITTAGFIPQGTERLYNAQQHLLKNAYRMIAPLVHPDRGGSNEMFQEVVTAYRLKDMTFLQELYLRLTKDSLFWRSSDEAIEYCKQEIQRPSMSTQIMQQTAEFQIVRQHAQGKFDIAEKFAKQRLAALVVELQRELQYMIDPDLLRPKE
jgi:hypothetical protein